MMYDISISRSTPRSGWGNTHRHTPRRRLTTHLQSPHSPTRRLHTPIPEHDRPIDTHRHQHIRRERTVRTRVEHRRPARVVCTRRGGACGRDEERVRCRCSRWVITVRRGMSQQTKSTKFLTLMAQHKNSIMLFKPCKTTYLDERISESTKLFCLKEFF